MQRLNKIIAWIGLTALSLPAVAQETHQFSLQQTLDYAKKNNVQVKNALLSVTLQEQSNREITAAAYPQINGNIGATYNPNVAVQTFPNFIAQATYGVLQQEGVKNGAGTPIVSPTDFGLIAAQFGTKYTANAGVSLDQILFDGQVFVGLQARATSIEWQKKNAEVTEQSIRTNVYKVYYQLVASKTQVELIDANIARLEKLQHDTKEIYKNGFAEKLDLDKLDVQMANLQTEKIKVLNSINNGYLGLKLLIGMPVAEPLVLTDSLNYDWIKEGILDNESYNYKDRKEYQYADLGKKLNEYNVKRYKLAQIPTVKLSGAYTKSAQRNEFNFFNNQDWYTISSVNLNISIPIFHGFAAQARIQQAKIQLKQTENQMDGLRMSIDQEVAAARLSMKTAIVTLDYQKKNIELAENVYNQTKKKYESGTSSNTDITVAETDLKQAQTNYVNAIYDAIIAKIDYLKATGKL